MSKEAFKIFARNHNELADYILSGKTNWQKLYELYEIYGENSSVWDKYFKETKTNTITISDLITNIKNIDLDSVQKGIKSIQKTIGLLQDIGLGSQNNIEEAYEPRPMYKYFDD